MEIKRMKANIGGEKVIAVNARDVWKALDVKYRFRNWILPKIKRYDFKEGIDFIIKENPVGHGALRKDYILFIGMAKRLAASTHTEKRIDVLIALNCPSMEDQKLYMFPPAQKPDNSVPEKKRRRGYLCQRTDSNITVLIERDGLPGVFDEFKFETVSAIGEACCNE